jgi:rhodanese-related sulfurtransferase/DNA-binding transcriptional ArsR family regulator
MGHRQFKERLYREFARIGGALASDRRLELLDVLSQGPRHVEALAEETDMSVANVSQHLQVLRQARLVETERAGTKVLYRLADRSVLDLWLAVRRVAETRLAEVDQLTEEFAVEGAEGPEASPEMLQQTSRRKALLIDVRPSIEYEHGHLPGSLSLPIDELPDRLHELPRDRKIVAYCRGAYCLFADEAVALLRKHGFDAQRMEGGWQEWWASDREVDMPTATNT